MIEVYFYGQLKRFGQDPRPDVESRRPVEDASTVKDLLECLGISPDELGHIFLNRSLLLTCSPMARWLRYPDAGDRVPAERTPWETPLRPGDRVALFGRDMALLVV